MDLSDVHPMPVHILKLWQVYLENVNPLLKVTHTTTLQPRIIEAAGDFTNIDPALETLMFSIYCMAIQSLPEDECMATFGSSRQHLLPRFQGGCQQALLNCGFLRRNDRDSLTALYLYLVCISPRRNDEITDESDVCRAEYCTSIVVLNPWDRDPYCSANGHPQ